MVTREELESIIPLGPVQDAAKLTPVSTAECSTIVQVTVRLLPT